MNTFPDLLVKERLAPHGVETFLVGGAVRDTLLGLDPTDRDYVVTGASGEELVQMLQPATIDLVGASFGVYKVQFLDHEGRKLGDVLDIALPRTERSTGEGHRDFVTHTDPSLTIYDDLSRRDFTINAIALNLESGEYIDPYDGITDLRQKKVIRAVGDPNERFLEDPLRIMRAFRFMAKMDFVLSVDTAFAIRRNAGLLSSVAPERIWQELWKMLSYTSEEGASLARALPTMLRLEVLQTIIPEYVVARNYDQGNKYHDRTLDHHMLAATNYAHDFGATPLTKLALLLHDLGKPETRSEDARGDAHYYGHEQAGARIANTVLQRLRAPGEIIEGASLLIAEHMRLSPRHPLGDKGVRRFMNSLGHLWPESLMHRVGDIMAHAQFKNDPSVADWFVEMMARCRAIHETTPVATFNERALALKGGDIMNLLGMTPGPELGQIKKDLTQLVIDGTLENDPAVLTAHLIGSRSVAQG